MVKILLEDLSTQKATIGNNMENYEEIRNIILNEFGELDKELKNEAYSEELSEGFYKISKLLEVLNVFDIPEQEKSKYLKMGWVISAVLVTEGNLCSQSHQ